jgi:hypothetical protein
MENIIHYSPEVESRLRNVAALPHGTGCNYLVCIAGENGELVAKQWKRKMPSARELWSYETVVVFNNASTTPAKRKRRLRSAMDIAADACGLVKVRGANGGIYYE